MRLLQLLDVILAKLRFYLVLKLSVKTDALHTLYITIKNITKLILLLTGYGCRNVYINVYIT